MNDENFAAADRAAVERGSALSVLMAFLKLGLMSFGGPVAHLGYFRDEFVARRKWLDEATYVDLVALCQFLPGPASSQVGISIGMLRAGLKGALAAWVGFTMPSALAMIAFAYGVASWADAGRSAWLHGLKSWRSPSSPRRSGTWRARLRRIASAPPSRSAPRF